MATKKAILSSECGSKMPHNLYPGVEVVKALRNSDGNLLSVGTTSSHRSLQDNNTLKIPEYGIDSSKEEVEHEVFSNSESKDQSKCFPRTLSRQKRLHSSDFSRVISTGNEQDSKLAVSVTGNKAVETFNINKDSYVFNSNSCTNSESEDG